MPSARDVARKRRLARYRRAGLQPTDLVAALAADPAITSPVSLSESQGRGALLAVVSDDGTPIDGTLFKTGDSAFSAELILTASAVQLIVIVDSVTEIDETVPLEKSGLQPVTYVAAFDPAAPIIVSEVPHTVLQARVWVDGRMLLLGQGTTLDDAASAWASSTATWEYGQVANAGVISPAELYLDIPGTF